MINFEELIFNYPETRSTDHSFVGIKMVNGKLNLFLPKGFKMADLTDDYQTKKELYFSFYKILKKFGRILKERSLKIKNPHKYEQEKYKNLGGDRDGAIERSFEISENTSSFNTENSSVNSADVIFYPKLFFIDRLLAEYDELKIISLSSRLVRSIDVNANDIHKYLHCATFLKNGAAYISSIATLKKYIQFTSNDIVTMYCYLVSEVKEQLGEIFSDEVKALSRQFKEKYIGNRHTLFCTYFDDILVGSLKSILELIHQNTAIKEKDYWDFYNAIDFFLYDNYRNECDNGIVWGFKNFNDVWESMCNTYLIENHRSDILYVDEISPIMPDLHKSIEQNQIRLHTKDINNLRPDAIIFSYTKEVRVEILKNICKNKISEIGNLVCYPRYSDGNSYSCLQEKDGFKINSCWNNFNHAICGEFKFEHHVSTQIFTSSDDLKNSLNIDIEFQVQSIEQKELIPQLEKFKRDNRRIIKEPIPSNVMSFWKVNTEKNNLIFHLCSMYFLNHVFWVALERGDINFNNFKIDHPDSQFYNAFYRRISQNNIKWIGRRDESFSNVELSEQYMDFCNSLEVLMESKILSSKIQIKNVVNIIDAKYEQINSYNMSKTKNNTSGKLSKDITMQLQYKKIVSEKVTKISEENTNYIVNNIFWLPFYHNNDKKLEIKCDVKRFAIGNEKIEIQVKLINFKTLAEHYTKDIHST